MANYGIGGPRITGLRKEEQLEREHRREIGRRVDRDRPLGRVSAGLASGRFRGIWDGAEPRAGKR